MDEAEQQARDRLRQHDDFNAQAGITDSRSEVEREQSVQDLARWIRDRPTRSEQSLEGAAVNGLTPVGQEAASE